ncbi:hypothetical protein GCM10026982_11350 [Nocardiopsis aegyptia]
MNTPDTPMTQGSVRRPGADTRVRRVENKETGASRLEAPAGNTPRPVSENPSAVRAWRPTGRVSRRRPTAEQERMERGEDAQKRTRRRRRRKRREGTREKVSEPRSGQRGGDFLSFLPSQLNGRGGRNDRVMRPPRASVQAFYATARGEHRHL